MQSGAGFAVYYEADAFSFKHKVMGRQSAGIGFVKALARSKPAKAWCYARTRAGATEMAEQMVLNGAVTTEVPWVPHWQPERLADPGLLFRPDPVLLSEAWRRNKGVGSRAYSLCGITHTTATHAAMEAIGSLATGPYEEWDALICTSEAVRHSVNVILNETADYLRERVGAGRFALPQLPVIPLGVHCQDFAPTALPKSEDARAALGIAPGQLVVLFVGRLSFHGKAHPLPMYLALEQVAREVPVTLVQAGWFGHKSIESAFHDDARAACPSVDYRVVDGRVPEDLRRAWAAADVFTSLADNVQETFGLTPIEAMAAGLPVVVSDWDGYKDTVRDGVDGFRVPTVTLPPGDGGDFATGYDLGSIDYDHYCGYTGQFVAVDVERAAEAFRRLARDPGLRRCMGEAGRERARKHYDWSVVLDRYYTLWTELHGVRHAASSGLTSRRRPDRPDPFTVFSSYPTSAIGAGTLFRRIRAPGLIGPAAALELQTMSFAASVLPRSDVTDRVLASVPADDWIAAGAISVALPNLPDRTLRRALTWLTKIGLLEHR